MPTGSVSTLRLDSVALRLRPPMERATTEGALVEERVIVPLEDRVLTPGVAKPTARIGLVPVLNVESSLHEVVILDHERIEARRRVGVPTLGTVCGNLRQLLPREEETEAPKRRIFQLVAKVRAVKEARETHDDDARQTKHQRPGQARADPDGSSRG